MKRVLYTILVATILFLPKDVFAQEEWIKENEETYYIVDGEKVTGFNTIDEVLYFFNTEGVLQTGWQETTEGKWYQREDGSVVIGRETIDGKIYYFGTNGYMQKGFIEEDEKLYFYSQANGALKTGWQETTEGKWYQREDGSVVIGRETIDGKTYYFGTNGYMQKGFIEEDGNLFFYSQANGALKTGWQETTEGKWYQREDGSVVIGRETIDGKTYYFGTNGYMQKGFIEEDGKLYFYSQANGALKTGWQRTTKETWYQQEDGEVLITTGVVTINGKEYFFEGRNPKGGIIEVDGKKYYFDPDTYEKQYSNIKNKYNELVLDKSTGEIEKKQYIPVYYRQKDKRWNNKKYGLGTFGKTGCAPTSMAMAYTSILQREVLPTEVADFLYKHTDQFNRNLKGTSGMGIIHASNYFQVKWKGIGTQEELEETLKQGKVVYASMQNGKFAKPTYNHVIVMYNYNENTNMTNVLDPLTPLNNGWSDLKQIWKEQCMDPDDRTGGYAFYSLEEK